MSDLDIVEIPQGFISPKHFLIEMVSGFVNWIIDLSTDKGFVAKIPYEIDKGKFKIKTKNKSIDEIIHDQKNYTPSPQASTNSKVH